MALEQTMAPKEKEAEITMEQLDDEEEKDLELAVLTAENLLKDGGFDVIEQAIDTSKDPSQVIGQFFVQLILKLNEEFTNENQLSRRIWLCKGGWLEQVMDIVIDEFALDYAVSDKAEVYVADTFTAMAKEKMSKMQAPPAEAAGAAPAMPEGAPV